MKRLQQEVEKTLKGKFFNPPPCAPSAPPVPNEGISRGSWELVEDSDWDIDTERARYEHHDDDGHWPGPYRHGEGPKGPRVSPIRKQEGGRGAPHVTTVPLTPREKRQLLNALPKPKSHSNNIKFWEKMDELREAHGLSLDDIQVLVKAKLHKTAWHNLPQTYQDRDWITANDGLTEDRKYNDFKTEGGNAYGERRADGTHITLVTQKPLELFEDYAERKFRAYVEYGGVRDQSRNDAIFLQMLKDGIGSHLSQVVDLGIPEGTNYTEVVSSAISAEQNQRNKTGTPKTAVNTLYPSSEQVAVMAAQANRSEIECFVCG
eukprot:g30038.t1